MPSNYPSITLDLLFNFWLWLKFPFRPISDLNLLDNIKIIHWETNHHFTIYTLRILEYWDSNDKEWFKCYLVRMKCVSNENSSNVKILQISKVCADCRMKINCQTCMKIWYLQHENKRLKSYKSWQIPKNWHVWNKYHLT